MSIVLPNDPVRVRTWQTEAVFNKIVHEGRVTGDGRRVDKYFKASYQWLTDQMRSRGVEGNGTYPLWVWVHGAPNKNQVCPGQGHCRYLRAGDKWCFAHWALPEGETELEIVVPANRLLVSDYVKWHYVLNNNYLPTDEFIAEQERLWDSGVDLLDPRTDPEWERRARAFLGMGEKGHVDVSKLPAELVEEYYASWERCIIDHDNMIAEIAQRRRDNIPTQATMWEIRAQDVRRYRKVERDKNGRLAVEEWQNF